MRRDACFLPSSSTFLVLPFLASRQTKNRDFENTEFDAEDRFFGGMGSREEGGRRRGVKVTAGRLVTTFLMAVRLVFKRLSA